MRYLASPSGASADPNVISAPAVLIAVLPRSALSRSLMSSSADFVLKAEVRFYLADNNAIFWTRFVKVKLTLEYAGQHFCGWQAQPAQRTVQGELVNALGVIFAGYARKLGIPWEQKIEITGSGRTDSGVHARGQVASFSWPSQFEFHPYRFRSSLNALTPREMSILEVVACEDTFDARFSPHSKCYIYTLLLRDVGAGERLHRAWCVPSSLDVAAMAVAARRFVGTHDFSSFRARDCSAQTTVRTILVSELVRISREELEFVVHGRGFMKQMIRIMTGTLVDVGKGRFTPDDIDRLIAERRRECSGPTAPPDGLRLEWVRYHQ